MIYQFVKFYEDSKILVVFLPPHTSHLLQPLDMGVFSAYKHWHSEIVEVTIAISVNKLKKDDFLAAIYKIRQKIFKSFTIK